MRSFYIHRRNGVYYAELINPATGSKLTAKSTGKTDRDEALITVAQWLRDGIPKNAVPQTLESAAEKELLFRQVKPLKSPILGFLTKFAE